MIGVWISRQIWFLRARVGDWLALTGMHSLPPCRYRRELSEALWILNFRVQARCAATHQDEATREVDEQE